MMIYTMNQTKIEACR